MQNFWENDGWELNDLHLSKLLSSPFQRSFPKLKLKPGLHLIRGPRQIGKTTWLKTLLRDEKDPQSIFYLSCDNITDHKELAGVLASLRKKKTILLDEVSFVKDWPRAIKYEIDSGLKAALIITGSHAADLRHGMDLMPGRFAEGGDIQLLPMNFFEFSEMRAQAQWPKLSFLDELKLYFRIGGFPSAVIEAGPKGLNPVQSKEVYQRWLLGDLVKMGKQEIYLRETLTQVAVTLSSPISLQTLARRTQMGSHHTALDYVEALQDCFALRLCYAIDPNTGAYRTRKDKKFYFSDPLLYWIALEWGGYPTPENSESAVAEMVAHEEIFRRMNRAHKRFGYFHSERGEIDFYCRESWAMEIKWGSVANNLSAAYKSMGIPEKILWTQSNFLQDWPTDLRSM